jgi:hypothetical protein
MKLKDNIGKYIKLEISAQSGSGSQQIDGERLKDNPRRLGKGQARLVGLAPLKPE